MSPKIGAIMLYHTDHKALSDWYHEKLGTAKPEGWQSDHYGVMIGDVYVGFDRVDAPRGVGAVELYFSTDNIDADFETVKGRGAKVIEEPKDQPWGGRTCVFEDPAGNKVYLMRMQGP